MSICGIFNYIPTECGSKQALPVTDLEALQDVFNLKFCDETFDLQSVEETDCVKSERFRTILEQESGMFQEKIKPWMIEEEDGTKTGDTGLIVCCSLLDKPNNLGGITRTAEIFSVSELVFDNLSVLHDKNYTSLAVTGKRRLFGNFTGS